jgi:hypothetical protein
MGCWSMLVTVTLSLSAGNGVKVLCAATLANSGTDRLRWKTMVFSSGVSMEGRSPDSYGPLYDSAPAR